MKTFLILCTCVFALEAMRIKDSNSPYDFTNMVKSYGYLVESYDVQTEDGYILNLFRIPSGLKQRTKQYEDQEDSSSSSSEKKKRALFLMHGLLTNSESFLYGGPTQSLALLLADEGFDVYLGNARGSQYGQRHTTLNPQRDTAFWKFCWQDIGTKDLPALLDKVLSLSGQNKLSYIGHNEGSTSFYVLASEKPEYNNKIDKHISLGPLVFMRNGRDEVIETIQQHLSSKSWLMKNLGISTFAPSNEVIEEAKLKCLSKKFEELVCNNLYFLLNGYNSEHLNQTTLNELKSRVPSMASVREVMHFVQLKASGRFQKYSEESQAEEFDLSKVTTSVTLFYTAYDQLYNTEDIELLASKLPNMAKKLKFENLNNNLDFLYSENLENVHNEIKRALIILK